MFISNTIYGSFSRASNRLLRVRQNWSLKHLLNLSCLQSYGGFVRDDFFVTLRLSRNVPETIWWSVEIPSNKMYASQLIALLIHFLFICIKSIWIFIPFGCTRVHNFPSLLRKFTLWHNRLFSMIYFSKGSPLRLAFSYIAYFPYWFRPRCALKSPANIWTLCFGMEQTRDESWS